MRFLDWLFNRKMTEAQFTKKVGSEPIQYDLDRVNCDHAGIIGHQQCGWCKKHDKPRFMCGCLAQLVHSAP